MSIIPEDPKLSEISNEFVSTPSPESLKTFYELVIDENSNGGRQSDFEFMGAPRDVSTLSATNVGENGATLNGEGNMNNTPSGAPNKAIRFVYGEASGLPDTSTDWVGKSSSTGMTGHSEGISGLSSGTDYSYRVEVKNGFGTVLGSTVEFTTDTPAPTCSSPNNVQGLIFESGGVQTGHGLAWEEPTGVSDGLYDVQRNVNGDGWNTVFGSPFNATNYSEDAFNSPDPYEIQYRVRQQCSSSNFSGYISTSIMTIDNTEEQQ